MIPPPRFRALGKWPSSRVALKRSKLSNALDATNCGPDKNKMCCRFDPCFPWLLSLVVRKNLTGISTNIHMVTFTYKHITQSYKFKRKHSLSMFGPCCCFNPPVDHGSTSPEVRPAHVWASAASAKDIVLEENPPSLASHISPFLNPHVFGKQKRQLSQWSSCLTSSWLLPLTNCLESDILG
jgi:hypothetical protein